MRSIKGGEGDGKLPITDPIQFIEEQESGGGGAHSGGSLPPVGGSLLTQDLRGGESKNSTGWGGTGPWERFSRIKE